MNKNSGQVSFFFLIVVFMASTILLHGVYRLSKSHRLLVELTTQSLCLRKYIFTTKSFIRTINKTNDYLIRLKQGENITKFIPQTYLLSKGVKSVSLALEQYQNARLVQHLYNIGKLRKHGCTLPWTLFKTPYQYSLSFFHRQKNGATKSRGKQWKQLFTHPFPLTLKFMHSNRDSRVNVQVIPKMAQFW